MANREFAFDDRRDAGRRLARELQRYKHDEPVVLALPRGGVPVAYEVAKALDAPLELLFVRKIGAPGHEELGLGAVTDGADPQVVLDERLARRFGAVDEYLKAETERQLKEIDRRRKVYLGNRKPLPLKGRNIIMVDDGIATGGTARTSLQAARKAGASRIILAVPLAPRDVIEEISREADKVICLATPEPFGAVGNHYRQFDQTSDEEVRRLCDAVNASSP